VRQTHVRPCSGVNNVTEHSRPACCVPIACPYAWCDDTNTHPRSVTGLLPATWLSTSEDDQRWRQRPVIAELRRSERNSSSVPAASVWRRTDCSSCNAAVAAHEALQGVQHACPVLDLSLELTSRSDYIERYPCKDRGKPAILEYTR